MPAAHQPRRPRPSARWRRVLCALLFPALAMAQAPEADLKAAIISNMLLFVEWPGATADKLVLCYQDAGNPVTDALFRLHGRTIKGRVLEVLPLREGSAPRCHAVYLAPGDRESASRAILLVASRPVLVVSDSPDYGGIGAMVNLEQAGDRVVFDIDLGAARKAGLQISSKALRLARQVVE